MSFKIVNQSVFDSKADAYVNTINCVGIMGAGIALEFKNRYPQMFAFYKEMCLRHHIKPGDCYSYLDKETNAWILNLAVKDDWRHWGTTEWMEQSLKSFKLSVLERDIKSVNMPLIGGKNARRGPYGMVANMTPPPSDPEKIKSWLTYEMTKFADKFDVDINLCIPEAAPVPKKAEVVRDLIDNFFTT